MKEASRFLPFLPDFFLSFPLFFSIFDNFVLATPLHAKETLLVFSLLWTYKYDL